MSLELHSDQPYAWLGRFNRLGCPRRRLNCSPRTGPPGPERSCGSVGRAPGVPVWKPAAPSPSAVQRLAGRPGGEA